MDSSDMPASAGPAIPELDKLINRYVRLRDAKRAMEAKHKEQLAPYNKLMAEVEGVMLDYMKKVGSTSIATPGGTAYQSTKRSATIKDGAAFRKFIVETGSFHLVDWRANANAVFEYIEANQGVTPPGVNPSSRVTVNFRRPGEEE